MHQSGESQAERVRASFMRRVVAFLIDGLTIAVVGFAVLAVATIVLGPTVRLRFDAPEAPVAEVLEWRVIVNSVLLFVVSAAYFVLSLVSGQLHARTGAVGIDRHGRATR